SKIRARAPWYSQHGIASGVACFGDLKPGRFRTPSALRLTFFFPLFVPTFFHQRPPRTGYAGAPPCPSTPWSLAWPLHCGVVGWLARLIGCSPGGIPPSVILRVIPNCRS